MLAVVQVVKSFGIGAAHWLALLRIGLGLWWLESFRHKDKKAWLQRNAGISWAASVAEKHKFAFVTTSFQKTVAPHPKAMSLVIIVGEGAVGLGVALGFLTPIALIAGIVLNLMYFVLMIHDWAEQGQNAMMGLAGLICLFAEANQTWSIDHALHIFGA